MADIHRDRRPGREMMPGDRLDILPLAPHPDGPSLASTVSFSVDGDAVAHYRNFAPPDYRPGPEAFTYRGMFPALLDVFGRLGIQATFFCIADQLANPEALAAYRNAARAGHRIGNHTLTHPDMGDLSPAGVRAEIAGAHEAIADRLGVRPLGYRAPAYHLTEESLLELIRLGYLYDSSVFNSSLSRAGVRLLGMLKKDFRPTTPSPLARRFPTDRPVWIGDSAGGRLLEWPIPQAFGAACYGTFHTFLPRPVFFAQAWRLRRRGVHVHYELHPIEVLSDACARAYPWLPTARSRAASGGRGRANWLRERLETLISGRTVVTLEESSAAYLRAGHR